MDVSKIEEYKQSISIDWEKVVEPETEEPEPEPEQEEPAEQREHPILIKIREDAKAGDSNSQFNLVIALVDGTYGEPKYMEAKEFARIYLMQKDAFSPANKKNSATVQYYEGCCYAIAEQYELANKILRQSIYNGCPDAAFFLAELMFDSKVKNSRSA